MSDETNPLDDAIEQAMDAFVYAPIGLVFDGPALFPKLVQSGRNQVQAARMMGQLAVQMGQGEATKRVARAHDQFRDSLTAIGLLPSDEREPTVATNGAPRSRSMPSAEAPTTPTPAKKSTKKATPKKPAPSLSPEALAIPDYDSLSASQVVKRLRGLAPAELDAVKAYESSTRARKTILNRITQLQKD